MSRLRFSVVVCTRDRSELLADCLESLVSQRYPVEGFEVVVVDDGSTDETRSTVERFAAREGVARVRYVHQEPSGVNAARNTGIVSSQAEVVFFVDDDELAREDHLSLLGDAFAEQPEASAIGGPARDYGGRTPRLCARCTWSSGVEISEDGEARRLLGGNMAIRRSVFDTVGMFDDALSGAGDDVEWFHRAGDRIVLHYDPQLWVWHRRDSASTFALIAKAYRQGLVLPTYHRRVGEVYRPRIARIVRGLMHAVRSRCTRGLLVAARELGAVRTWLSGAIRAR